MDLENLKTASLYINNQLLSRGLLRDGQNIGFARPDRGEGGLEQSMGRIMGVVNDLILRRDASFPFSFHSSHMVWDNGRDATQRENLTNSLRTLKADALRQTTDLERLNTKHIEAERKLGISEATTHALQLQLKTAESKERALREEMARMKELVKQTRNQCAVEVRKRERVVEGLKKHVGDGRVRGGGKNPAVREIVVVAGVGERDAGGNGSAVPVGEEGYDLRSETNEFLTELARGLSEENEHLAALARRTLENLRVLSGWEKEGGDSMVVPMEMGPEVLAADMESVIEHVRTLLTNPSFVPLEEVEVREEEIIRLREGWERMESRWREAVLMMDGWRKRMARSGQTVNLEELKMGLKLSPLKHKEEEGQFQLSTLEEEGEGDTQADIDAMDEIIEPDFDELDDTDSSMFEEEPLDEDVYMGAQEPEQEQEATFNTESSAMQSPPQLSPLRETSGNRHTTYPPPPLKEKGKEGFSTIVEENTYDLLQLATSPEKAKSTNAKSTPASTSRSRGKQSLSTPPEDEVDISPISAPSHPQPRSRSSSPNKSQSKSTRSNPTPTPAARPQTPKLRMGPESRLPRPREQPPPQSPLTMASIAAKLAASEREADAARVRAKIKAARMGRQAAHTSLNTTSNTSSREEKDAKSMPSPPSPTSQERSTIRKVDANDDSDGKLEGVDEGRSRKRKARELNSGAGIGASRREGGRAARRRSTLSPWELESLILGGAGAGTGE